MQKIYLIVATLCATVFSASAQYIEEAKQQEKANIALSEFLSEQNTLFNFDWKFCQGNPANASAPDFDDSQWRSLDLPHDFQFEQPWDSLQSKARGFKQMCDGWYRKTFVAKNEWKNRQVLLDFGGIMYYGDVYINGTKVASSEYGYVGLEADITKHLRYGQPNTVAVYANTGPVNGSRWYTGGGLFRDVRLKLQNPTHIARHGVYITTPEVSAEQATVNVQIEVDGWQKALVLQGNKAENAEITLETEIYAPDGQCVGKTQSPMPDHTIQRSVEVKLPSLSVATPQLWSTDTPYLYNAHVAVKANGITIDSTAVNFGIRKIEFGTDYGFKLNGKKIFLQGMANHHDMGAVGVASFDRSIERMMLQLKAFGFNTIRCSHNPYSETFTQIADRVGMIIVDEFIDKWSDKDYWGGREPFTSIWPQLMTEWIKRDRNCPSVVLWSLGNELQTRTDWSGYNTNDWGITTYRIFDQLVKRYDNTRKTTVAMFPARAGGQRNTPDFWEYLVPPELACVTEVSSFNYQWKAYHGYYEHKPDLILFQSEAVTNEMLAPFFGMNRERGVGLAYWGAIEYWGESSGWPKKGWNFSYFNHTLQPYPQAYLIKSAFESDKPLVHIGVIENSGEAMEWNDVQIGQKVISENWNLTPKNPQETAKVNLYTYTNADEVELILNGKSFGTQKNERDAVEKRNMILWEGVPYQSGKVTAIARNNGQEVARHELVTTGKPVALKIEAETPNDWHGDGMDLQYLYVYAIDSKGRRVPNAVAPVTLQVDGEASLYALDNGDHYTDEIFTQGNTRTMHRGFVQAIVRSSRQAGKVTIKASAPGLKAAQIKLMTK